MTLKTGSKGFTLIEVMVTVSILSLSVLMIQQGLLRLANILDRQNNLLIAQEWVNEKRWDVEQALCFADEGGSSETQGVFEISGREFQWQIDSKAIPSGDKTFEISYGLNWHEGHRPVSYMEKNIASFNKKEGVV